MSQSTRPRIVHLPYIDIQHDALAVFDDVEQGIVHHEDIWVSGYKRGETSVHGKARVEAEDGGRSASSLTARDGVNLERKSKTTFIVSVPALDVVDLPIQFPRQIIRPPYSKSSDLDAPLHINSLALNPKSQHVVLGGPDGYAVVLPIGPEANMEKDAIRLKGHVGDVRDVKWFPSGEVILTASSDLSLRIFGKDGINPRTFRGHTRALTSTAILGVGKQVLSGSKDGTIRLWDVSKALEEKRWLIGGDRRRGVEGFVVIENDDDSHLSKLGLEKEEKALLVATQDDLWIQPWSVEEEGWLIPNEDSGVEAQLVCFAFDRQTGLVVTGHSDGIIALRHISSLAKPLPQIAEVDEATPTATTSKTDLPTSRIMLIRRNEASIYSLAFGPSPSEEANDGEINLYVGTAAGLPARLGIKHIQGDNGGWDVRVIEEYAGWEAVGIETWGVGKDGVWCAGGEGGLRRYTT